jgi:hypothetical protein
LEKILCRLNVKWVNSFVTKGIACKIKMIGSLSHPMHPENINEKASVTILVNFFLITSKYENKRERFTFYISPIEIGLEQAPFDFF